MTQLPPTQKIAKEARSGQDTDFITDTPCRNSEHDKPKLRLDQVSRTFASELKNLTYGDRHLEAERPMNPGVPNPDQEPIQGPEAGTMSETADRHQLFLDENKTKTSARIPSAHKRNQEGQTKTEASTVLAVPLIDLTGEDSLATIDGSFTKRRNNISTTPEGELGFSDSLKEALYLFETFLCPSTLTPGGIEGPVLRPRLEKWRSFSSVTASSCNETTTKTQDDSNRGIEQTKECTRDSPPQKVVWVAAEVPKRMGRGRGKPRANEGAKPKIKPQATHFKQWRGQTTVLHSARMNRAQPGQGQKLGNDDFGEEIRIPKKTPDHMGATERFLTSTQRRSIVTETGRAADLPRGIGLDANSRLSLPKPVPATDARKRKGSPLKLVIPDRQISPMKRHAAEKAGEHGETYLLTASTLPIGARRDSLNEVEDRLNNLQRGMRRRNPRGGLSILPHPEVQDVSTSMENNTLNRRFISGPSIRGNNRREATGDEEVVILASNVKLLNRITKLEKYATLLEGQVRRLTRRDVLSEERLCHAEHVLPRIRRLEEQTAISGSEIRPPLCRACYVDLPAPEPYYDCRRNPRHPEYDQRFGPINPEPRADLLYPTFPKLGPGSQ